jgi:multiple sugar transport system substrate-binding protein
VLGLAVCLWAVAVVMRGEDEAVTVNRERVVFWHFWGGEQRQAVQEIVRRFNESQTHYQVVEVSVPGQNLDMKFFMSLVGGDAPDLLNQDDQIVAQWADRGVLTPIRKLTRNDDEYNRLYDWLNPSARKIGTYDGELYALCNAIDVRALFYRKDALGGHPSPSTIAELDRIAMRPDQDESRMLYLPDDRRLWAWGVVFGGNFYDETTGQVTADHPRIVEALEWMVSNSRHHGVEAIRAFRSTNREAGAGSMLLEGRYGLMMDGQWRVAEMDTAREQSIKAGRLPIDYGVVPLPAPSEGRERAGWVNGNFFVVPKGCRNPRGAWEFMKFWSGFDGHEADAAISATSGGWIPASRKVVEQPDFQAYLKRHPHFQLFVDLADSPSQMPTPMIPVQAYYYERLNRAVEEAMSLSKSPKQALREATRDVQMRLNAARTRRRRSPPKGDP